MEHWRYVVATSSTSDQADGGVLNRSELMMRAHSSVVMKNSYLQCKPTVHIAVLVVLPFVVI